jgi:hypothetical protein
MAELVPHHRVEPALLRDLHLWHFGGRARGILAKVVTGKAGRAVAI